MFNVIFGGAGFIGSNLINALLINANEQVLCVDNLSRGREDYIQNYFTNDHFCFEECDITDYDALKKIMCKYQLSPDITRIWQLAANSDIPAGVSDLSIDLKDTFLTTVNLLKLMKAMNWKELYFASTSAIYGDHGDTVLHEEIGKCLPISNYGAMKLASEAAISAACEDFLDFARVYRFPNVIGIPATHGVIFDFITNLLRNPTELTVLGNGSQRKSYLHVSELIDAILFINANSKQKKHIDIFNIGPNDNGIYVHEIAKIVADLFDPLHQILFGTENRGWIGDVPRFNYSIEKLTKLGWAPKMHSREAIKLASIEILNQLSD